MAPEQIEGRDIDGSADQYALAAIASGAHASLPFPRDSDVALIAAHLKEPLPPCSGVEPACPPRWTPSSRGAWPRTPAHATRLRGLRRRPARRARCDRRPDRRPLPTMAPDRRVVAPRGRPGYRLRRPAGHRRLRSRSDGSVGPSIIQRPSPRVDPSDRDGRLPNRGRLPERRRGERCCSRARRYSPTTASADRTTSSSTRIHPCRARRRASHARYRRPRARRRSLSAAFRFHSAPRLAPTS